MGFYVAIPTQNIGNGPTKFCYEGNSTVFSYSSYISNMSVFAIKDETECTCNVYYISSSYTMDDFNVADGGGFFAHDSSYNNNFTSPKYLPPGTKIWSIGYHVIQDSKVSPEGQFNCPAGFGEDGGVNGVHCILLNIPTTVSGSFNTWKSPETNSREIFTTTQPNAPKTSFSVTANHKYQFSFEVFAEKGYDGIMVSTNGNLSDSNITMGASASGTSGYITHCDGNNYTKVTKTISWDASSSGTIYIYFKMDGGTKYGPGNQGTYSYGYVQIKDFGSSLTPVTITFNANGGSGGTTSLSGYAGQTPRDINNGYISRPTRSGTNGNFEFLGYFSATSGGTQYYDQYGTGLSVTFTGNITLYAHWKNRVVYPTSHSLTVWADYEDDINSTTTTSSSYPRHFDLNDSHSWYCNAGTVTMSNLTSGFSIINNGSEITIPSGKDSMDVSFKLTSPSSAGNYEGETITVIIYLTVKQNYISDSGEGELIIDQKQPVPASITRLSKADLSLYFDVSRYATYVQFANGYMSSTGSGNLPTSFWTYGDMNICWASEQDASYMYFDDLGTTCCESSVKRFNGYNGSMYTSCYIYANYADPYFDPDAVPVGPEDPDPEYVDPEYVNPGGVVDTGVYWGEKYDYVRGSNYATLTVNAVNSMALNTSTPITVRADFTSGSSIADVTGDCVITTEPTGIIEIV
jgi:hypothetical protein